MTGKVIGARELAVDLETMQRLIKNPEIATKQLDRLMRKHAPERTGYLKSTTYYKGNVAGAKAIYAGWVELMGPASKYAYAPRAIEDFSMDDYADEVVEPL